MTAVYTNKAPGGVAYACSFRITEAVYLVERLIDCLAYDLEMDPTELRIKNFIQPDQFPYTTQDGLGVRLRRLRAGHAPGHGDGRLRRAPSGAGREARQGRADGHRRGLLHRGRRRRAAQGHGHPRPRHGRRQRAAGAPHRQGDPAGVVHEPGPGPRDDLRADRGRGARHPAGRHPGAQRRHREHAVRARHLRQPLHAGVRRGRRARWPARCATRRRSSRRGCSRCRWPTSSGPRAPSR